MHPPNSVWPTSPQRLADIPRDGSGGGSISRADGLPDQIDSSVSGLLSRGDVLARVGRIIGHNPTIANDLGRLLLDVVQATAQGMLPGENEREAGLNL